LKKVVKNFVIKNKLQFLINEEKMHKKVVEALFQKMFPGKDIPKSDKSLVPRLTISLKEDDSVVELLESAMEAERISAEFYDSLSQEVEERGIQEILLYLSSMEHGHYALLKGEYDLCVRDEMYYERDDFQYDMVHIGP
jgi:rubrerythrin